MRVLACIFAIFTSISGLAQNKLGSGSEAIGTSIRYIGSSELKGSSDVVIVDDVALAHTAQFLPLDSRGNISHPGDLSKQVDQVFQNLSKALKPACSDIGKIVKLNIFLKSVNELSLVQHIMTQKFEPGKYPAITFAVGDLAHPEALISLDAVAVSEKSSITEVQLTAFENTKNNVDVAILPKGPVVYVSGQAAKGGLAEATRNTLEQLDQTLIALGISKKSIVQIKSFLSPMSSLAIVKQEFAVFFNGEIMPPLIFVDWLSTDPVIEIELIASSPLKTEKTEQVEFITPPGMASSPVYSKVSRLNYGKKIYLSGIYGINSGTSDSEVNSVFESMGKVLKAAGSSFENLLKATYYITNDKYSKSLGDLRPKYYDPNRPPAASKAMLKAIGLNGAGISVDMIGTVRE